MQYRFYLSSNGSVSGATEVFPLSGMELGYKYDKESDYRFHRRKLNKSIILAKGKDNGYSDLKELADSDFYGKIYFVITKADVLDWTGEFSILDCKFDIDGGAIVEFKPVVLDEYTEILKNKDREVNVLGAIDIQDIDGFRISYLEYAVYRYPDLLDYAEVMKVEDYRGASRPGTAQIQVREILYVESGTEPSGINWHLVLENDKYDKYARRVSESDSIGFQSIIATAGLPPLSQPIDTKFKVVRDDYLDSSITDIYTPTTQNPYSPAEVRGEVLTTKLYRLKTFDETNYSEPQVYQARTLQVVLDYLISEIAPNISGVQSSVLLGSYFEAYIIDKSDFIYPEAAQAATKNLIKFTDFFEALNAKFEGKLFWFIDENNKLRIEQELYLTSEYGLTPYNLLEISGGKYCQADKNYTFDKDKLYNSTKITENETFSYDWGIHTKIYDIPLIDGESENAAEYQTNLLFTDVDGINRNIESATNSGLVLVATSSNSIRIDESYWESFERQNARFSTAGILDRFCKSESSLKEFTLTNEDGDSEELTDAIQAKFKLQTKLTFVNETPLDWKVPYITNMGLFGRLHSGVEFFANGEKEIQLLY